MGSALKSDIKARTAEPPKKKKRVVITSDDDIGNGAVPVTAAQEPDAKGDPAEIDIDWQLIANGDDMLEVAIVWVTPALATAWLATMVKNRKPSRRHIDRLARIMREDKDREPSERRWKLNGETIIFDEKMRLIEGQQRLLACIESDGSFPTLVVRGVAHVAFSTLDGGKRRSLSDVLGIMDHTSTLELAAVLGHLFRYERGEIQNRYLELDTETAKAMLELHPDIYVSVKVGANFRTMCAASVVGFCHYLFSHINAKETARFFEDLKVGAMLPADDPVLRLRRRLEDARKQRGTTLDRSFLIALFFKAWNLRREGRRCGQLVWRQDEPFPVPK